MRHIKFINCKSWSSGELEKKLTKRDWKELLKKYIKHVGDCEGTDFIEEHLLTEFAPEEREILINLSSKAIKESNVE